MKTNGISNPIGYELGIPSLSWIIRNAPLNSKLVSSRVEISEDESFNKILSDSGPKKDLSSIDYRVNFKLLPRKRYFWRVTAELTNITIKSPSAYFETSKLDEPWQSNWISPKNNKNPPLFRKQFTLKENHENARIYITGLGLYELYINGKRVSNELFTPFCNSYEKWIQYQTFDVTDFIQKGENVIGVIIGDGWAKGRWGFAGTPADMTLKSEERGFPREISTSKYLLNVEMHIKTEDNSEVVIVSDETWKTSKSEILFTNIYDGEVIDSNLIQEGWSNIDFDDSNWESVQIAHHKSKNENSQNYNDNENNIIKNEEQKFVLGKLTARYSIPVIVKEEIKPKQIIKGENGDIIIDMGKNIVGWLQFSCHNLPKNFEIVLEFGEILQNNNFFRENLRNAQQQFRYVSNGKKSVKIHPHFTFYGFQYVRLTNWPTKNVNINDFLGLSIYSDFEQIGFVKTSDSLVNKLIDNILWSQKDNFLDVPTDCPQRDERMGWTGDAQSFSGTALFNSDCYAFYRKYAHDLALMQTFNDGMVPNVVPYFGPREKLIG